MRRSYVNKQQKNSEKSKGLLNYKSLNVRQDGIPLLLVDCNPICYAAFHTTGALSYNGKPTGVIYGFLKRIFDFCFKFKTNKIYFFWDAKKNYRYDYFPEYKIKRKQRREQMEAEDQSDYISMLDQMVKLNHEILPQLGFNNTFVFHGFEADDLIAYVLKTKNIEGRKIIISCDADLFQLLDKADIYLYIAEKIMNERLFKKKYGIEVKQWVLAKSIGGCNSDDIPGIDGVSDPKHPSSKALKFLKGELPQGKIYDRIVSQKGINLIRRNKVLNKLPYRSYDIPPIKFKKDEVSLSKISKTFVKFGFQSLCEKDYFDQIRGTFGKEME